MMQNLGCFGYDISHLFSLSSLTMVYNTCSLQTETLQMFSKYQAMERLLKFLSWLVSVKSPSTKFLHMCTLTLSFVCICACTSCPPNIQLWQTWKELWHSVIYRRLKNKEAKDKSSYNYSLVFGISDNLCNGFGALIESLFPPCLNFNYAAIISPNLCKGTI